MKKFTVKLIYSEIEHDLKDSKFSCGTPSIDKKVRESFYPHILNQAKTFSISLMGHIVGYYSVSICVINAAKSDADFFNYVSSTSTYSAIKLDFLAVDKRLQNQHIGTVTINQIILKAKELYYKYPVRLIILDALREKYDWYQKHGFKPLNSDDLNHPSETIRMYLDLMPNDHKNRVEQYCNEYFDYFPES